MGFPPQQPPVLGNGLLLTTTLSFLSSRAKPRDLQFRGPFLETQKLVPPQICHLDRSVAEWRDLRFSLLRPKP
ncbi:MAG: hypothetical protein QOH35_5631 [Acidobacteriaceae bacterium]|nr:hypothetical protein [Acidobacteriaceae bacterium]